MPAMADPDPECSDIQPWLPLKPVWPVLRPGRSLLWPLPGEVFAALAPARSVDGLLLRRKREFHATLLDAAVTARLATALAALPRARAQRWRRGVLDIDWRWRRTGEYWLVARPAGSRLAGHGSVEPASAAHSIVESVEQPAQHLFRQLVGALLGDTLPGPVPHVTLYTHGDAGGIGLPDEATFRERRIRRL